ncbi:hypothetical protein QBC42DRAFT_175182 [Cladorrhinum samala]|uniref:Hikeshi-like domain-containing protein n=1 Tax=Cladorrhinum samala TaxID=585594 RepID=A0AAV9HTG7_9PEZI|nr:hypothetical protein QBC42DRAFT_175182 [Cladorrhinum samala]
MTSPLFGLILSGQPCTTTPSQILSETTFLYTIPPASTTTKTFTHVTIFLLPGITLPPNTGAAIYFLPSSSAGVPGSDKFAGAIGPGKESTLLKVSSKETVIIGIALEPAESILEKVAAKEGALVPANSSSSNNTASGANNGGGNSMLVLAEKIIGNAFNYLASYGTDTGDGRGAVVPLRAFEEWWKKFQTKARHDPDFLERV